MNFLRIGIAAVAAFVSLLGPIASASADHNPAFLRQASTPGGDGVVTFPPGFSGTYLAASDDGSRAFWTTPMNLLPEDSDSGCTNFGEPPHGCVDVYELSDGVSTLLSTGPSASNGSINVSWGGSSADGSRVFFVTAEQLTNDDTDSSSDVYERSGGVTTPVSVGPNGGNAELPASFNAVSTNGSRLFFSTAEALTTDDTDTSADVYERSGGVTTLVSIGPDGGNGAFPVTFGGISRDGSRAFFTTGEALTSDDTDTAACIGGCVDVYERSSGTTTLISTSSFGGNGGQGNIFSGVNADGSHVFFLTWEALDPADIDTYGDIYQRANGVTTRISTGPRGGNGIFTPEYKGVSDDGSHVYMLTRERFVDADADALPDVYVRHGSTTELASTGPTDSNDWGVSFRGASADGSRIWFVTSESLVAEDTNGGTQDVYEYSQGVTTLVSVGANGLAAGGYFAGASRDGKRVFVNSTGQMVPSDSDGGYDDIYERFNGASTLISRGLSGGNGMAHAGGGVVATPDAAHVFFFTPESLVASDTNSINYDIYEASLGYDVPQAATTASFALVPAFRQTISNFQCQARGGANSTHGAPLAFSSCDPPGYLPNTVARLGPQAGGSIELTAVPGVPSTVADEADLAISVNASDVRDRRTGGDYDPSAGGPDATITPQFRISDTLNNPGQHQRATGEDIDFLVAVDCAPTPDPALGSDCTAATSADAIVAGSVKEGRNAVWQAYRIWLKDSGANNIRADADDRQFAQSGIYVP
jgi:hypothetical protein